MNRKTFEVEDLQQEIISGLAVKTNVRTSYTISANTVREALIVEEEEEENVITDKYHTSVLNASHSLTSQRQKPHNNKPVYSPSHLTVNNTSSRNLWTNTFFREKTFKAAKQQSFLNWKRHNRWIFYTPIKTQKVLINTELFLISGN